MNEQQLEKFDPTAAELTKLADKYKDLVIKGPDDMDGYAAVHVARVELKKTRTRILATGKELRADAVAFQKAVIAKEKELVALIEPVEKDLAEKQEAADAEKLRLKRAEILPKRKERLDAFDTPYNDEMILDMDDDAFEAFYNKAHADHLAEKEAKLKEEQERKEREEREAKERAAAEEARIKAEAERVEREKREAAEAAAKREAEMKAEEERLAAEKKRLEEEAAERAAAEEERQKREAEERAAAEERARQEEREKIERERKEAEAKAAADKAVKERQEKVLSFMKENGVTDENAGDFKQSWEGDRLTLYKKVAVLDL